MTVLVVVIRSQPTNDTLFMNYHITHHAGTALHDFISTQLIWDGMNGMYNVPSGPITKEGMYRLWTTEVQYAIRKGDSFIYPVEMQARTVRKVENYTAHPRLAMSEAVDNVLKRGRRQFLEVEQSLKDHVYNALPIDHPNVRSMVVMKNPAVRAVSADRDTPHFTQKFGAVKGQNVFHSWMIKHHNYALKWLSGMEFDSSNEKGKEDAYHKAAERLRSFEHIVIQEAMPETTYFFCTEWKLPKCIFPTWKHAHQPLFDRFGNISFIHEFLEQDKWNFKLYDLAISIAKEQIEANNLTHSALDTFPNNTHAALLKDLTENTTRSIYNRIR